MDRGLAFFYIPRQELFIVETSHVHRTLFFCLGKEEYAVEYALEYGFLRLSPETRKKLGIPVMLIELGEDIDDC